MRRRSAGRSAGRRAGGVGGMILAAALLAAARSSAIADPDAAPPLIRNSAGSYVLGRDLLPGVLGNPLLIVGSTTQQPIVGEAFNGSPPATLAFPTGVTGVGRVPAGSEGNQALGLYGRGELHAPSGVVYGAEFDAENKSGNEPDRANPPNTAIGSPLAVPIGAAVACVAHGGHDCSVGLLIGNDAADYRLASFNAGIEIAVFRRFGLWIDAQPDGTQTSAVIKNNGAGRNLQLITTGRMMPYNSVIDVDDGAGASHFSVRQNGDAHAASLHLTPVAAAALPGCDGAGEGSLYAVTDAAAAAFNAALAGGGVNHVLAYCDGRRWRVH